MVKTPLLLVLPLAVVACSKSEPAPTAAASTTSTAAASATPRTAHPRPSASPEALKEIAWSDPPEWTKGPSGGMRVAQYKVPHAGADTEDAECTVITLGRSSTVDDNVDRWVKQFDGGKLESRTSSEVSGMKATTVEVSGGYRGMARPGEPPGAAKAGWYLLGAVVEAPSGLWFFKLTGPAATVKAAKGPFDKMIASIKKA